MSEAPPVYSRKNPCAAQLKSVRLLTMPGSEKDTRHYEVDLRHSGLTFEPGDSLALFPKNCPDLVEEIIGVLGLDPEETVTPPSGSATSLRNALIAECVVTQPDRKLLAAIAERSGEKGSSLAALLDPECRQDLNNYLWGREVIDLLLAYPEARFAAQEFIGLLKKLQVRLYSIASSLCAYPNEVHLTVATVVFESFGRKRKGVCTTWLAERVSPGDPIPCFITPGKGFRLPPPDDPTPIIMIGPGTGIAPFRAFLQERRANGAQGKAWLFFGEQRQASDFFYKDEWEALLTDGTLDRFDTAFSRDQDYKIYVQDRLRDQAADLWRWIDDGAIVYVCGDAARMAVDVDRTLHEIAATQGGLGSDGAAAYIEQMRKDKRYRRDVY